MEFNPKQEEEITKLATNLRRSKIAHSDSQARQMAIEMLNLSKRVRDDFAQKEKEILGNRKPSFDEIRAHNQLEQLASNMTKGKSDVRIHVDGLNESKSIKQLVNESEEDEKITRMRDVMAAEEHSDAAQAKEDAIFESKMKSLSNNSGAVEMHSSSPAVAIKDIEQLSKLEVVDLDEPAQKESSEDESDDEDNIEIKELGEKEKVANYSEASRAEEEAKIALAAAEKERERAEAEAKEKEEKEANAEAAAREAAEKERARKEAVSKMAESKVNFLNIFGKK